MKPKELPFSVMEILASGIDPGVVFKALEDFMKVTHIMYVVYDTNRKVWIRRNNKSSKWTDNPKFAKIYPLKHLAASAITNDNDIQENWNRLPKNQLEIREVEVNFNL